MNNLARNIIIWLIFGAALIGLFNMFQGTSGARPADQLAYSDFMAQVKARQIEEVLIDGRSLRGKTPTGQFVTTVMPPSTDVVKILDENDVRIIATPEDDGMPSFFSILLSWFPMLPVYRYLDFLHAPDAGRVSRGNGVWQIAGKAAD